MAISEKKLKEIQKRLDKSNEHVIKLYKQSGDEALLEMLYLNSEEPQEVAEEFEIPLEVAERLVEKDKAIKEEARESLLNSDDESEAEEESEDEIDDDSEDEFEDSSDSDLSDFPEKVIEAVCFIGEVIQDASEKICDVLDESVERIKEFDFDK